MKAVIRRGKYKGREVEISQWCNDWFTTNTGTDIDRKPFSPSSLAFTHKGMLEILKHKNNGQLLNWFIPTDIKGEWGNYFCTFKKRKYN